uniref:Photosystem II 12 kDa extrinsic protein n=1 Tax=Trieres chinensis TaxID=1514140 RepID=A0A6U1Z6I7_TRICV|mmetsp:Transcript_5766/g.12037  ORF Transcript_5766/g.12037 Transcript_5766/m.12037 type:complete len:233 (+) Transcript_5766:48-746(+)
MKRRQLMRAAMLSSLLPLVLAVVLPLLLLESASSFQPSLSPPLERTLVFATEQLSRDASAELAENEDASAFDTSACVFGVGSTPVPLGRRSALGNALTAAGAAIVAGGFGCPALVAAASSSYSGPTIDVNNAMAREFTAFPGLYPTIATKIVEGAKNAPYKSKADVYDALDSEVMRERLRQYDAAIVISKPDAALKQFKASQICKYECGSRTSNTYRDEQIRAVQSGRSGME